MNRNYDTIREMRQQRRFESNTVVAPPPPSSVTLPSRHAHEQVHDLTQRLVQQTFLQHTGDSPRMVVFTGIDHRNGCSEIATSVAKLLAEDRSSTVCLVEANFRSPALASRLGTKNFDGLEEALMEESPVRSFVKPVYPPNLYLLPAGRSTVDGPGLLASERMSTLVAEMRSEFDFVIVDAPPLNHYSDALVLGRLSDGVVLVVEANRTSRDAALVAVRQIRSSKVRILGAVLNKRTFPIPDKLYALL
jgi:polysaccharide biosynthesis transport protein